MGISDLIPGVSGGTIALVLGIYQSLIAAINGLFSKQWKEHVMFLVPLGIGIVFALLTISHLVEWLLVEYPQPTFFFFLGLIIAIIPTLLKDINYKQTFTPIHYVLLAIGAILVSATFFIKDNELATVMSDLVVSDYILLFFAGWLASSAMILPGISGSFIFLLLGVYPTVVNALSTFNIPVIIIVGSGIAIGLVITSRFITFLFKQYKTGTYALMIGFIVGSIVVIYPGVSGDHILFYTSVLALFMGGFSAYLLSYFEMKKTVVKLNH
jgi:putative membrane protein